MSTSTPLLGALPANPPGLSAIADRAGDFAGVREALLRPLPGEVAISGWRPAAGDLGLQVLEWWAYLADILTFYNERYANESYLRTATRDVSVADLVALLGYRPAPGLAATGTLGVVRRPAHPSEPLVIPAGMPVGSVATPGIPAQTFEVDAAAAFTDPSQLPVALEPDTTLALNSDGSLTIRLAGKVTSVAAGDELLFVNRAFAGVSEDWAIVTVTAVAPAPIPGSTATDTTVTVAQVPVPASLKAVNPYFDDTPGRKPGEAYAVGKGQGHVGRKEGSARKSARTDIGASEVPGGLALFGGARYLDDLRYYAYQQSRRPPGDGRGSHPVSGDVYTGQLHRMISGTPDVSAYRLMRATAAAPLWSRSTNVPAIDFENASTDGVPVNLAAVAGRPGIGDLVLLRHPQYYAALGSVTATTDALVAVTNPADPGDSTHAALVPHTVLTLDVWQYSRIQLVVMNAQAQTGTLQAEHSFRDVGTLVGVPPAELDGLPATVDVPAGAAPAVNAAALLQGPTGAGAAVTVTAVTADDGVAHLTLGASAAPETAAALDAPLLVPLRLLLDTVPVSRGVTVPDETLGSGNAALAGQSFTLAKGPLTYLPGGAGPSSTLTVSVNGIAWQEVASFYGQSATATVYVVTRSPDGATTTVTFGDGADGARLPTGTDNVHASYRFGGGALSPPAKRLQTILRPQANLASIENPVAVTPGADPEPAGAVRSAAPESVTTFGRAISAGDYEQIAAGALGVARTAAVWTFDATQQRALVTVYVGDDADAATAAAAALAAEEDPRRPITVLAATPTPISLSATLVVDARYDADGVLAAATAAVADPSTGVFAPDRMRIGALLYRSTVAAALSVAGVIAIHQLLLLGGEQDVFDPGAGGFFTLDADSPSLTTVTA